MESSRLKLLFFCISIQLSALPLPFVHSQKFAQLCTNSTMSSTYANNLNHLFSTLTADFDAQVHHGFYNSSYGENSDKVNAIGLCRGDVKSDSCRGCFKNATNDLTQLCPMESEAIVWYDECMLTYSNRSSIIGTMRLQPYTGAYNVNNVSDVNQFNPALANLLSEVRTKAASGDSLLKFATGNASASNSESIYGLAQCTPDLSQEDCNNCLSNVTVALTQCCSGKQGARLLTPSCNIRYETYIFYDPLPSDNTPAAPAPSPSMVDAPTATPTSTTPPPPNSSTRKGGDYRNISFQVFVMVALLVTLQYFGF